MVDSSHEEIPERDQVVLKKKPERKESDNPSQEAYETSDFGGPEPKKNNEEQAGVYFDGEFTENQQPAGKQRLKEPRKAEAEEEEEKSYIVRPLRTCLRRRTCKIIRRRLILTIL